MTIRDSAGPDGAWEAYERYARPAVARLLRAFGLDVAFAAAEGDHLFRSTDPAQRPVLDLVGGYGASMFGHHHPALVAALQEALLARIPMNAQASVRPAAARLARRLSGLVGRETGDSYVVTLGCTGSDAVEAAMKHAAVERNRRLAGILDDLSAARRRVRRDGLVQTWVCADGRRARLGDMLAESISAVATMQRREPCFVSLHGAFHGKTTGAGVLTESVGAPDCLRLPGPRRLSLSHCDSDSDVRALDDELVTIRTASFDAAGTLVVGSTTISTLAAAFVEPIQGEGGVREVSAETLRGLRALSDRHGAALVFDEIQSGMGRTGTFLASTPSGVHADYYLLAKSLGGGLMKVSALLVSADRYVDDFGRYHTSTFADDDLSAVVSLAALDLLDDLLPSIADTGARLRDRLQRLIDRWPGVFAEIRGRGLLLGLELWPIDTGSTLLHRMFDPDSLGYLVAGYLLQRHDIRVLPTLSAPTTLRIQPSAYIEEADMDLLAEALEDVAARIERREFATLLDHLARPAAGRGGLPRHSRLLRRDLDRVPRAVPLVAFLANLEGPATVRRLAPELSRWSDRQCEAVLDRMLGELGPFVVSRSHVRSATAGGIELMVVAVPFTADQAMSLLRAGERSRLSRMVLDAVEYAADAGAAVIGLGGYTSIVTDAAREVVEDTVRVTTGNSLAAACAYQSIRRHLEDGASRRVGVVGALGNIGAVLSELLVGQADSIVLVGRSGSVRRLRQVADNLGGGRRITVTDDMGALRDCDVVVTASNSPNPVVHRAHLNTDGEVLVYDLAVPGDVDTSVSELPRIGWYAGGRMNLPLGQEFSVPGTGLPPGVVHACLAETMLMGFEPDMGSLSHGGLTAGGLRAAWDLAARHGFEAFDAIQERSLV